MLLPSNCNASRGVHCVLDHILLSKQRALKSGEHQLILFLIVVQLNVPQCRDCKHPNQLEMDMLINS